MGKTPLYQLAVEALLKSFKAEDIYISTKRRYLEIAASQSPQIPKSNYILEPDIAKDRGPGEGYAYLHLSMKHPDEPFMIIQSDVLRTPDEAFLKTVAVAQKIQERDRKFMTGGVKATYPIFGIDYLRLGKQIESENGVEIFQAEELIPRLEDYQKTKDLLKNFYVATHSNHSCWYPDLMLEAYQKYRPDWHQALMKIRDILTKGGSDQEIDAVYSQMEAGATELVFGNIIKESYIILLPFKWTDIGTWDSVYEFFDADDNQVHSDGNILVIDSKRSIVKCLDENKLIAVLGIDNLVVIDTEDALLVCDKSRAGEVKSIVELLKERKIKKYT